MNKHEEIDAWVKYANDLRRHYRKAINSAALKAGIRDDVVKSFLADIEKHEPEQPKSNNH